MVNRAGLVRAALTLAAVIASFVIVYAVAQRFGAGAQPAIVAAILAIGLSRRPRALRGWDFLAVPLVMVCIALAAAGIGLLLRLSPVFGAIVFTAGMSMAIWLRNFGPRLQRAGELLALPLVTMLIVPPPVRGPGGLPVDLGLLACAGLVSLGCATAFSRFAPALPAPPQRERASRAGFSPATRMAAQLAVALGAAFVAGEVLFPAHWGWTVLTAFIVCSGALGREDAVYRGILRLAGALAGTIAAGIVTALWTPSGPAEAAAIFALLFLGLWLRDANYGYWACCITLILALLAPVGMGVALLGMRLEAIFAGAVCAVLATWFVYPIRTEDVVRRRLADLLVAIDEVVAHVHGAGAELAAKRAHIEHRIADLERVAPPVEWHHRLFVRADRRRHPAGWIRIARDVSAGARELEPPGDANDRRRLAVRRAIGVSRRAIADHGKRDAPAPAIPVGDALDALRDAMSGTSSLPS